MSRFDTVNEIGLEAHYSVFGDAAVYTTAAGVQSDITIILESLVSGERNQQGSYEKQAVLNCRVRKSEVAQPGRGDTITFEDVVYQVTMTPLQARDTTEWELEASSVDNIRRGGTSVLPRMG